ncbi:MAG: response regulator [Nannocystaceae bacterium]
MSSQAQQRILLIDDDELIREVFVLMLERRFTVDSAATGEEALALLESGGPYTVIVCDLQLPDMDGRAIFEAQAAAGRSELQDRMLFCTGGSAENRLSEFLVEIGEDRVLNKPCRADELFEAIDRMIATVAE